MTPTSSSLSTAGGGKLATSVRGLEMSTPALLDDQTAHTKTNKNYLNEKAQVCFNDQTP